MRDGIKGGWSDVKAKGFVSGATGKAEDVKFGIVGSVNHPQVDYSKVDYCKSAWAAEPYQSINYVSCHDDNTLDDKLKIANPNAMEADLIRMNLLSNAIVLTSQGVPFLQNGVELLRTKMGNGNSYNAPDSINEIDWSRKTTYKAVFNYYQSLIALRKAHPAFRMPSAQMIREHLQFIDTNDDLLIAYQIVGHANKDRWNNIFVVFNGSNTNKKIKLPAGKWHLAVNDDNGYIKDGKTLSGEADIARISACILYQE